MKKTLIILMSTLLVFPIFSSPNSVGLEYAIEMGEINSSTAEKAKIEKEKSIYSAEASYSYIPDISLNGSITSSGSPVDGNWNPLDGEIDLGISFSLGTTNIGQKEKKELQKSNAELNYSSSLSSLRNEIINSFFSLSNALVTYETTSKAYERAKDDYSLTLEKYESGLIPYSNVLEAQYSLLSAEYNLDNATESVTLRKNDFSLLTGIYGDYTLENPELVYLDLPDSDELFWRYGTDSTKIKLLENSYRLNELALRDEFISDYLPSGSISAQYSMSMGSGIGSSSFLDDKLSLKVGFSIPISSYLPNSKASYNNKAMKSSLELSSVSINEAKESITASIEESIVKLKQKERAIALSETKLKIAQEHYQTRKEAYEAGIISYSDLSDASENLTQSEINLRTAELEYTNLSWSLSEILGIDHSELIEEYRRVEEDKNV